MGEEEASGDDPSGIREAGHGPAPADQGLLKWVPARSLHEAAEADPEPIPSYRGLVEPAEEGKTGICCSGGGIRSAAFNLGALQSLHDAEELPNARYLAAVSGGSYICAAYSMVGKRWKKGSPPDAKDAEGWDCSDPYLFDEMRPFARNSPEEQYLRNRSSYMAPDGWAKLYLGIRLLVGLLVNVIFIALPVFGISVLAGVLLYAPLLDELRGSCSHDCSFQPSVFAWGPPALLAVIALGAAFVQVVKAPPTEKKRRRAEWCATRLLVMAGLAAVATLVLPGLVDLVQGHGNDATTTEAARTGTTGGAGLLGLIAGVLAALREAVATPRKAAETAGAARRSFAKLGAQARRALVFAAATLAGPLMVLTVCVLGLRVAFNAYESSLGPGWLWAIAGGTLVVFALLYWAIDITSLSLHPFYKRRLCTAFALKRVKPDAVSPERAAVAMPQEMDEGLALERDYELLVTLSDTALDDWPALIICAAANISDQRVTPPGRPVTSFTFSANTVGGPLVGAMKTKDYEQTFVSQGRRGPGRRDFSLPAAVAMSGAAVAPSMGKTAPRAFTFLLTLANIRLGVWVPNPRWVAKINDADQQNKLKQLNRYKRPRPSWLFREMIGRNSVNAKYLYVSDGGHYENLGLVELLRRGCTRVFCLDASGGSVGGELGDAVAIARSELGVEVDIDPTPLMPEGQPPTAKQDTVSGKITYPDGTKGTIVYACNVISPSEPWDIRAHQLKDARFPHDSTLDQLYTDQKFESYRALGAEAGAHAVERMSDLAPRPMGDSHAITPTRVKHLLDIAAIQLVDIRHQFAYDTVHVEGAMHIEPSTLQLAGTALRPDYPIVFLCGDGERSRKVARAFRVAEWDASSVEGGMARWIGDQVPLAPKDESG